MNALQLHIQNTRLEPESTMNALTEAGIISDNAVAPADVADADCSKAVFWLLFREEDDSD